MGDPATGESKSPFPSKKLMEKLSIGIDPTLTLNLTELNLPPTNMKSLYDACFDLTTGAHSPSLIDFKDIPKRDQGALMKSIVDSLNDFRNNYSPSIHPGNSLSGESIRSGFKASIGYDPTFLPNELVLYLNRDGAGPGGGVGVKFTTKSFQVELGVHFLPKGYEWEVPGGAK